MFIILQGRFLLISAHENIFSWKIKCCFSPGYGSLISTNRYVGVCLDLLTNVSLLYGNTIQIRTLSFIILI